MTTNFPLFGWYSVTAAKTLPTFSAQLVGGGGEVQVVAAGWRSTVPPAGFDTYDDIVMVGRILDTAWYVVSYPLYESLGISLDPYVTDDPAIDTFYLIPNREF